MGVYPTRPLFNGFLVENNMMEMDLPKRGLLKVNYFCKLPYFEVKANRLISFECHISYIAM
jgi:hypothetical protein